MVCAMIAAVIALVFAARLFLQNKSIRLEDPKVIAISGHIREGAMAFLRREYTVIAIFAAAMALILVLVPSMGIKTAISFLGGALLSALAGFVGMRGATLSNARTAEGARRSEKEALTIAFSGGSVMGMCVVGLGLLGMSLCYLFFRDMAILTGFSLGASSVALFSRVGGGIYTKAADVGADLVGKVEKGIPEDDHRNPAVIADNVGDNVGDVAGMGADLFESYVGAAVSALTLGIVSLGSKGAGFVFGICAMGLAASVLGVLFVLRNKDGDPQRVMLNGTYVSMGILLLGSLLLDLILFKSVVHFVAIVTGVISGAIIGIVTEWYTSGAHRHVRHIVEQSKTGEATNILEGLSVGMQSALIPVVIIAIAVLISFALNSLFGVALSALGMLATVAAVIAVDAYGPIADNAGGIAQMADLPPEVRKITDKLDSVGNTTAAIGKGFAIGSAALTTLALLSTFTATVGLESVNLLDAAVIAGLFIGGGLAYLFSSLAIEAVSKSACSMIEEVRRQFREIRGIWDDTAKPDYARCVDIATTAALKEMVLPGLVAVLAPIVVGFILGTKALAGMLMGVTLAGVLLALQMSNSGGAWDNAKKSIEEGNGDEAMHVAAVIGDTVGDPLKDTAGPSINILIKLMSIIAILFAPLFMR